MTTNEHAGSSGNSNSVFMFMFILNILHELLLASFLGDNFLFFLLCHHIHRNLRLFRPGETFDGINFGLNFAPSVRVVADAVLKILHNLLCAGAQQLFSPRGLLDGLGDRRTALQQLVQARNLFFFAHLMTKHSINSLKY